MSVMKFSCSFQMLSGLLVLAFMSMLVLQYMLSHLQSRMARSTIASLHMNQRDSNTLEYVFRTFVETAVREHVEYFIFYGSLLGAFRHHGRIPWDDDCDVMISIRDQDRVLNRFNQLLGPDVVIVETGDRTRSLKMFAPSHSRVLYDKTWRYPYIDIAFYEENSTHIWDPFHADSHRKFLKKSIFPLSDVLFEGNIVKAPNDIKRVLTILYGNYHDCLIPRVGHTSEHQWQKDAYKVPCKDL